MKVKLLKAGGTTAFVDVGGAKVLIAVHKGSMSTDEEVQVLAWLLRRLGADPS